MDLRTAVQPQSKKNELSLWHEEVEVITHDISKEEMKTGQDILSDSEMEVSELPVSNSKVDRTSHSINSCKSDPPLLNNNSAGAPVNLLHPGPINN